MGTYLIASTNREFIQNLSDNLMVLDTESIVCKAELGSEVVEQWDKYQPDMVFIDMNLGDEVVEGVFASLNGVVNPPMIVVIAETNTYAKCAFENNAADYLLKPVRKDVLSVVLSRLSAMNDNEQVQLVDKAASKKRFRINTREGFNVFKAEDVLYCLADRNYTTVMLIDGTSLFTANTLSCVTKDFPKDLFFRVGRSAVINIDYLKEVSRKKKECVLRCNDKSYKLPISLNKVQELCEILY
ncbi:response regulator transcription factor [Prolixibacteraceae bacterium JC049]|nr:response regulator transcription factor [Prolixibacteraceae bacterium JC049]